ncbi:ankyrin repeat-containing domain protein [Aspergillus avenaceus]|uniref:Ankyrin repeat-containing domain protein n=1 Tax=Aspergillus avenaceus TaxID=36643 RepID=A0A5N6U2K4_ASPAV|nr:ankyrin repeat-containing domain protein [Aspergillus avenaceus]
MAQSKPNTLPSGGSDIDESLDSSSPSTPRLSLFKQLPGELILQIADCFEWLCDIIPFLRTNRYLYLTLRPYLYKRRMLDDAIFDESKALILERLTKSHINHWKLSRLDPTREGMSRMWEMSVSAGLITTANKILKHKPTIIYTAFPRRTALRGAAVKGNTFLTKLLLERGDTLNVDDSTLSVVLYKVLRRSHVGVLELLLKHGQVDVNIRLDQYKSLYQHESLYQHWSLYQYESLFQHESLFHFAVMTMNEDMLRILLKYPNLDVTYRGEWYDKPLMRAIEARNESVMKLLMDSEKIHPFEDCRTLLQPLIYAIRHKYIEGVKLLLETKRVNLGLTGVSGETPLCCACHRGSKDIVELLLNAGLDGINTKDRLQQTPLWHAATRDRSDVVKLLLATGKVDLTLQDLFSNTAFDVARGYSKELLREAELKRNNKSGDQPEDVGK